LNNFLRQYQNDGRYDRAYAKWIQSNDWQEDVEK
jgi:polar amino acid transport system substrate-binding protein